MRDRTIAFCSSTASSAGQAFSATVWIQVSPSSYCFWNRKIDARLAYAAGGTSFGCDRIARS